MKELSHIKALALDLDGTLLRPDKSLSERNLKALRACMERGIKIILATGRAVEAVELYRTKIGTAGPHVYYNGAEVVDMGSGEVVYSQLLDGGPVQFCLELSRKFGHYFQVYFPPKTLSPEIFDQALGIQTLDPAQEVLLTEKLTGEGDFYHRNSGVRPLVGNVEAALSGPKFQGIIKCMFITKAEVQDALRNAIAERFGDSITIVRSSPIYLEVIAKGVSKGTGLHKALEYAGIDPQAAIAFGDEENDLPMFSAAGFSAAPTNSIKEALEKATFTIPSNADDGVACFLEEKLLA